jgi:hypothetical protein
MIDLSQFNHFSRSKKIASVFLLWFFTLILFYFFILRPKLSEIEKIKLTVPILKENESTLTDDINRLNKKYAGSGILLFSDLSDISKTIITLLSENNLSLEKLSFLNEKNDSVDFQIQINGEVNKVVQFLKTVSHDQYALLPINYSINKKSKTALFTFETKISDQPLNSTKKIKIIGRLSDNHKQWILIQSPDGEIKKREIS